MDQKIVIATKKGNLAEVEACLLNGANVDARDENLDTLVIIAAAKGYLEIVKYLVENGADIDAKGPNFTPLTAALGYAKTRVVDFLIVQHAIKKGYIELEGNEDISIIVNKLITTLLYESKRHEWDSDQCQEIRDYIEKLKVGFNSTSNQEVYIHYLNHQETENNTFYGSYLSDDSDSDEETSFIQENIEIRYPKLEEASIYMNRAQIDKLSAKKKNKYYEQGDLKNIEKGSVFFNLTLRSKIHYGKNLNFLKIEQDLAHLNFLIREGFSLDQATHIVETKFYVAQSRGITYLTTKWNKPSRMAHRKDSEIGEPQYSASIYQEMKINLFRSYAETKQKFNENINEFNSRANLLREILLTLREARPYSYRGYTYRNLAYVIQNIYTEDYDRFHRTIKEDPLLKELLLNDGSPFFSMGDTPYHPLKYAYGIKPYKGHESERLRPRWRSNGRAERPYSGSVYVSLHPLTDFDQEGPLHLISLNRAAEIKLQDELVTIPERETCFSSYLPKQRVIYKHVAKYPSFKQNYKQIYFYKYGLTEELYNKFKLKLQNARPHTPEMKEFKKTLGEWLCSYHEARLIDIARRTIEEKGGVLIYQDVHGQFSLCPPVDSVNRNTNKITADIKTPVKQKQRKRASLSPNKDRRIQLLSGEDKISDVIDLMDKLSFTERSQSPLVLTPGNSSISTPLSLLVNAIRNNRLLALDWFLKKPFFQKILNEKFSFTGFEHATLLHFAVSLKNIRVIKKLLENSKSIDINAKASDISSRKHKTALEIALDFQQKEIIGILVEAGCKPAPLPSSSSSNPLKLPDRFIKLGLSGEVSEHCLCGENHYKLYEEGKFVEYFYEMAAHGMSAEKKMICYELAVDEGIMPAYDLGLMYLNGRNFVGEKVEQNFQKAAKYFKLDALKGVPQALTNLGICYMNGQGVKKNLSSAVHYFQLATQKNVPEAYFNLAYCYENGLGLEKDLQKAEKYKQLGNKAKEQIELKQANEKIESKREKLIIANDEAKRIQTPTHSFVEGVNNPVSASFRPLFHSPLSNTATATAATATTSMTMATTTTITTTTVKGVASGTPFNSLKPF